MKNNVIGAENTGACQHFFNENPSWLDKLLEENKITHFDHICRVVHVSSRVIFTFLFSGNSNMMMIFQRTSEDPCSTENEDNIFMSYQNSA